MIVYEIYVSKKDSPNNSNLFIYNADNGKELISFMTKKHSEWEPFISNDESVLAIMLGGDVHFYEISGDAFTKTSSKLTGKVGSFSLSPGNNTHVAVYLEGAKGSPSMTRLFKYSNLDSAPVASKSFSQTDKVEMIWSKKGNGCLIMTTNDVDSTGASYYGKQALHFLATNGDSFSVPLSKFTININLFRYILRQIFITFCRRRRTNSFSNMVAKIESIYCCLWLSTSKSYAF